MSQRAQDRGRLLHVDSCQLRSSEGQVHLFVAIDRVSKFAYVEFHPAATMATGAAFMRGVVAAYPHALRVVLTDNGVAFTNCPRRSRTGWCTRSTGPPRARDRAPPDAAELPVDERAGRAAW